MSTNASIIVEHSDGDWHSIYVHWDGYLSGVGSTLHHFYNNQARAEALVALGNLSSLEHCLVPAQNLNHTFDHPEPNVCVAYGRDRNEPGQQASKLATLAEALRTSEQEYNYVFTQECWHLVTEEGLKPLTTYPEVIDDSSED